mgnify:FL=1
MTLLELFKLLRKHLALVVALPIVLAIATAGFSWGIMQNQYTATVSVYVLTAKDDANSNTTAYNDRTASQRMATDIATLAKSETVQKRTAESLGMASLAGYKISVEAGTTTRVISISVTAGKADAASIVANEIASVLSTVAQDVMGVESVNVVDAAQVPESPSGPPRTMYTAVAFLAGIFLAVAIVVLLDMRNPRLRNPEAAEERLGVPVSGRIPTIKG